MNVAPSGPKIAAASTPPAGDDSALSADRPFPGLRPFAFADRAFFFGRERQVYALYRLVENGRFIAVIGSSGSGKSSLVLAGLRGLLAEESADPGGANWVCLDMRPGATPLARLAKALARLAENDDADQSARRRDRIEYRLRQSSFSFESALEEAGGLGGRTLLLVVDQFEELFRFGLAGLGLRRAGLEETRARDEATQFVQILLDADRRRLEKVRVLVTMRSDFIGDCAYFHGLSEAVSATQYLVPNLTRGQLEDVIRKPIDEAGATIESELVERLINDCGDELDQLPVLQHCLMRLWDRAGAASAERPRRLTRQTYDDIGRMSEALSRHADEILAQCAGKEVAVEQAFRALSELDREGRAIRRALRFDGLLAETGVADADLRAVLDRFRAPSCSFIVPPPSVASTLAVDDRIDIGHETLLRRWKKLAAETETVEAATGRPREGWLGEEQADGQRYRTLVSLLEGEAGGESANLTDPERTKRWWDSLPRTAAWADRYGGRFEDVRKLIDHNITAKQQAKAAEEQAKRRRRLAIFAIPIILACVVAAGFWAKLQNDQFSRQQELDDGATIRTGGFLMNRAVSAFRDDKLSLSEAKGIGDIAESFVRAVWTNRKASASPSLVSLWVDTLNNMSDFQEVVGNSAKALDLAMEAKSLAESLAGQSSTNVLARQELYDSTIRVGNSVALSRTGKDNMGRALQEYGDAMKVAVSLAALEDSEGAETDIIDAHMKIGDVYKIQKSYPEAFTEYRAGLSSCQAALDKFPQSLAMLRNREKAHYRIAEAYREQKGWDDAEAEYRLAEQDQIALVNRVPQDPSLKSNLAATYNRWGLLARDKGDLNLALSKLQQGVAIQEELVQRYPSNPQWKSFVAPNYDAMAQILQKLDRPTEALDYLQKSYDVRKDLSNRNPDNFGLQQAFANAAKALGGRSDHPMQLAVYRDAVGVWKRMTDESTPPAAAKGHYDDVFAMAQAFDAVRGWRESKTAYLVAEKIAQLNLAVDPNDAAWIDKAKRAKKGAEDAAAAIEAPPAAQPN
jgi:tetratricopeptide (TPR) repeat protein